MFPVVQSESRTYEMIKGEEKKEEEKAALV